jgi:hypothetical protein
MNQFINKTYLLYVLLPIIIIGGVAVFSYSPPHFSGIAGGITRGIYAIILITFWILMILLSLPILLLKKKKYQNDLEIAIWLWFILPLLPDILILMELFSVVEFRIGFFSIITFRALSLVKIIGLSIGFYKFRKELQTYSEQR